MANYTIKQCLKLHAVKALSEEVKAYLEKLSKSSLPTLKGFSFTADNETQLVEMIEEKFKESQTAKEERKKRTEKKYEDFDEKEYNKKCMWIVSHLIKGDKFNRRLISAKDLLPRLEKLKKEIENENRIQKVENFISKSGMTKDELLAYLNGNQSDIVRAETSIAD